ncbi:MAG TPA: type I-U CRISPR-associated protein Cas5/Cas6 [Firmicutes bacterium]|nr:type I-U CRISPR-associated protein Cas5/Cas6 [Bacillota bacterium]
MFALAINYLNGWAMAAADGARKEEAEWPPHPDRVYMALVAAWFETGEDPDEGEALRWLESLDPPAIAASDHQVRLAMDGRRPIISYVPVNDIVVSRKKPADDDYNKLKKSGLSVLPEHRPRQPRSFPVAIPHKPIVYLIWPDVDPGQHRTPLERLVRKVTHIGHSASFVQIWVEDNEVEATWIPVSGVAQHRLRVPNAGRLQYLTDCYKREDIMTYAELTSQAEATKRKQDKQRIKVIIKEKFGDRPPVSLRPSPGRWQGYARQPDKKESIPGSIFDPNIVVLALSGKRLLLSATAGLVTALRNALMKACPEQPPPEWLSGHSNQGQPSHRPHMAFMPLAFVGSEYADGYIMGLALALPRNLDPEEAARCLGPILHCYDTGLPRPIKLFDGKWFACQAEIDTRESPPFNMQPSTWTRPARIWASVTPVVLDRHFDGDDKWELAVESLKEACTYIGLPRPSELILTPISMFTGVPHSRDFPRLRRKSDGGKRFHSHVVIMFPEPVCGPVLIGAGRYRGYGLCRPLE